MPFFPRWPLLALACLLLGGCTRSLRPEALPAWGGQEQALLTFAAGQLADGQGDFKRAVAFYYQTLQLDPQALSVRRYLVSDLLRLGKPLEAIGQFLPLVQKNPRDTKNQYLLGQLYEAAGDTRTAEQVYLRARDLAPRDSEITTALAVLLLKQDRGAEGRHYLEMSLAMNLRDREARRTMVKYLLSRDQSEAAANWLRAALASDPEDREWLGYLAKVLSHQGKDREAFLQYQKLLVLDPEDADVRRQLADYYVDHRQWKEAAGELEWLFQAGPENPVVRRNLGLAYYELGDMDQARTILLPLAEQDTADALTHYLLGSIYRSKQLWRLALQEFNAAVLLDPNHAAAQLELAQMLIQVGESANAVAVLEAAGPKISHDPRLLGQYGLLLLALNRPLRAREAFTQALRAAPRNAELQFQLGRACLALNQFDDAVSAWERAVKLNPKMAEAYNHLGYLHAERKLRLDQAVLWIRKALALDPKNGDYRDSLAWAYYQQGKYPQALKELKLALKYFQAAAEPVDPVVLDHLGEVYLKLGRGREAESAWQHILKDNPGNLDIQKKINSLHFNQSIPTP